VHIPQILLLHDSKLRGKKAGGVKGVIQLLQPVITVCRVVMLIIVIQTSDGVSKRTIEFTPRIRSSEEDVITVGVTRIKVSWSVMDR
jgi:flagellar biosynthesis protein FliQ